MNHVQTVFIYLKSLDNIRYTPYDIQGSAGRKHVLDRTGVLASDTPASGRSWRFALASASRLPQDWTPGGPLGLDVASRPMSNPPLLVRTRPLEELCLETLLGRPLEVEVRDSVDKALKILKQKMSKEGILQEIKRRRYYEKPSVKRKRKMREARKRRRREAKRRVVR